MVNILLLLLVFGAARWKKFPYGGALALAVIKGILYTLVVLNQGPLWVALLNGVIGFTAFGALAAGMVYFLRRLDRGERKASNYTTHGSDRMVFKWEYFPLSAILVLLIFGEMWADHIIRSHL